LACKKEIAPIVIYAARSVSSLKYNHPIVYKRQLFSKNILPVIATLQFMMAYIGDDKAIVPGHG
jgi:hypothetical protein